MSSVEVRPNTSRHSYHACNDGFVKLFLHVIIRFLHIIIGFLHIIVRLLHIVIRFLHVIIGFLIVSVFNKLFKRLIDITGAYRGAVPQKTVLHSILGWEKNFCPFCWMGQLQLAGFLGLLLLL